LKKRTKKLFPGASHEAGRASQIFSAAGRSTWACLQRWGLCVRRDEVALRVCRDEVALRVGSTREKFFGSFFQKRTAFFPF
jgi:hypothetical protein